LFGGTPKQIINNNIYPNWLKTAIRKNPNLHKILDLTSHDLPHIFKRLYRSSSITHNDDESRGLGLAISKEIIHIHDGDIWAESEENIGSIFYISLPVYPKVTDLDKL